MSEYTSIRVRKDTKRLLEKVLIDLESRLGRRLDYDELLRILAHSARARPWLLRLLIENPVEVHDTEKARQLLRREKEGHEVLRSQLSAYALDASVLIEILAGSSIIRELANS